MAGVAEYEKKLYAKLESDYSHLMERIASGYFEDEDVKTLKEALGEMKR